METPPPSRGQAGRGAVALHPRPTRLYVRHTRMGHSAHDNAARAWKTARATKETESGALMGRGEVQGAAVIRRQLHPAPFSQSSDSVAPLRREPPSAVSVFRRRQPRPRCGRVRSTRVGHHRYRALRRRRHHRALGRLDPALRSRPDRRQGDKHKTVRRFPARRSFASARRLLARR